MLKWTIGIACGVLVAIVLLLAFLYFVATGMGGWEPHRDSAYAVRARSIDAKLRPGMTRQEIKAIFQADIDSNPKDSTEDTSDAYWGQGVPTWAVESDLYITEPRPHFWNSFDTGWSVRVGFDNGKLAHHVVEMSEVNGP
jgi:hypothetical protein